MHANLRRRRGHIHVYHLIDIKIEHSYILKTGIIIKSFIHDPYLATKTHVPVRIYKKLSALSTDGKHRN